MSQRQRAQAFHWPTVYKGASRSSLFPSLQLKEEITRTAYGYIKDSLALLSWTLHTDHRYSHLTSPSPRSPSRLPSLMQVSSLFAVLASLASTLVLAAPASLVTREDAGIALIVGPQYRIDSGKAEVSGSKESVGDSNDRWWGPDVLGHVSRTIHIGGLGELFEPA